MKKLPNTRLDHVIEYGERLRGHGRGYTFMDSPGNDLESIAGQVCRVLPSHRPPCCPCPILALAYGSIWRVWLVIDWHLSLRLQVASGCNLILFTTGNGSITNFPFVPPIKVILGVFLARECACITYMS